MWFAACPYKGDGNYCYDVWMGPKNKWTGEVISRFDAHQPGFDPQSSFSRSGGRLLMRLRVGDMIEIGNKYGQQEIMRVQKMTAPSGGAPTLTLAEHNEANVDARNRDKGDLFTYRNCTPSALQKHRAVRRPTGRTRRSYGFVRPASSTHQLAAARLRSLRTGAAHEGPG